MIYLNCIKMSCKYNNGILNVYFCNTKNLPSYKSFNKDPGQELLLNDLYNPKDNIIGNTL